MNEHPADIRLATIDDEPGLVPLMAEFNAAEDIAWNPSVMLPALRKVLQDRDLGLVVVARESGSRSPAGYALATFGYDLEFGGRDAFITELFVQEAARGRGLGRALLDAAIEQVQRSRAKAVHLMVRPENGYARALYEKRGFAIAPRIMMTRVLEPEAD